MYLPDFSYEKELWSKNYMYVAGTDEVGRGSFAGPVVAACVVFIPQNPNFKIQIPNKIRINDSKKLTSLQREKADEWIRKNALAWGIGKVSVRTINRIGMGKATMTAFRRAVASANSKVLKDKLKIEYLLVDAFYIPNLRGLRKDKQLPITKGDEKSFSIAAASIVAKVYRDKIMQSLGEHSKFRKYDWGNNKGYGTKYHREIILEYGITEYHRKQFVNTFLNKY